MKKIKVKCISNTVDDHSIEAVSVAMDSFEKHMLDFVPWKAFPYKPKVTFSIAYNASNIFIKFFVAEKHLRAKTLLTNGPVHEDSCVEFFISFKENAPYYNIEFNSLGIGLIGYGTTRNNRELLSTELVKNLQKKSLILSDNGKGSEWELTLTIPLTTFVHSPLLKLKESDCSGNFYKCGDLLPEPHFISWSNIISDTPNFHLADYFGKLIFE